MYDTRLYQEHLNRVSRSFAKSIEMLDDPLRHYVSLSYLLCRMIDTIEDEKQLSKEQQKLAFEKLKAALNSPERKSYFLKLIRALPWSESAEKALMMDSPIFIDDFHRLPLPIKNHIRELSFQMMDGMWHFLNQSEKGKIQIRDHNDLNTYCFFVAGVVGECLTKMVANMEERWGKTKGLVAKSHAFGLFLQKVNILKDQWKDEKEGRFFVPNRKEVYQNLLGHARDSYDYICSIPSAQKAYKVFCLSAFLLGLQTIKRLDHQQVEKNVKVPRLKMVQLFMNLEGFANSNHKLTEYIEENFPEILRIQRPIRMDYQGVQAILNA